MSLQGPSVRRARAFRLWTFHTRPSTFSVSHLQHVAAIPVFQTKRSGFLFHEHSVVPMSKIIQQKITIAPHWNFLSSTQYRDFQVRWCWSIVTWRHKQDLFERWDSLLLHSFRFSSPFGLPLQSVSELHSFCEYTGLRPRSSCPLVGHFVSIQESILTVVASAYFKV